MHMRGACSEHVVSRHGARCRTTRSPGTQQVGFEPAQLLPGFLAEVAVPSRTAFFCPHAAQCGVVSAAPQLRQTAASKCAPSTRSGIGGEWLRPTDFRSAASLPLIASSSASILGSARISGRGDAVRSTRNGPPVGDLQSADLGDCVARPAATLARRVRRRSPLRKPR